MDLRYIPADDDRPGWERQVMSECGELIQAITKAQQFGYAPTVDLNGRSYNNRNHVVAELRDLEFAIGKYRRLLVHLPGLET